MYHQFDFTAHYLFIGLLFILSLNMYYRRQHFSISNRWFLRLTASMIILLGLEIISWVFDGIPGEKAKILHISLKYLFYLSNLCAPVIWLNYIDYKINGSAARLRKRLHYSGFIIAGMILLAINLKTGWIYSISSENIYRSHFYGVIGFTAYLFFIIYSPVLFIALSSRKVDKNILIANFFFSGLPLAGAALQILTGSVLLVWNCVAMAIVAVYIFLELSTLSADPLTGLINRKQMEEWLYFRTRISRKSNHPFTLIMIDLDDFKQVNDLYGHNEGDQALIHFAHILRSCFKQDDQIARFAGDEFLVSLECSNIKSAAQIIQRLRIKMEEFNRKEVKPYSLACSCGITVYSADRYKSYEDALKDADRQMYRDKDVRKAGRVHNSGNPAAKKT